MKSIISKPQLASTIRTSINGLENKICFENKQNVLNGVSETTCVQTESKLLGKSNLYTIPLNYLTKFVDNRSTGRVIMTQLQFFVRVAFMLFLVLSNSTTCFADAKSQAIRIYGRIAGGYPSNAVLQSMITQLNASNPQAAVAIAMSQDSFYNVNLKNWFTTWTNTYGDPTADLNDFTATAIGLVRDGSTVGFDQALYGDIIYVADPKLVTAGIVRPYLPASGSANPDFNEMYVDLQTKLVNPANIIDQSNPALNKPISLRQVLVQAQQSVTAGHVDNAGVLTTNAAGAAFFSAGTNRRAVRFAFKNFLCKDIGQLSDTTRSDYHVRQDVSRSPGGDSKTYINTCKGCHAGMDALAGAFAHYDYTAPSTATAVGNITYNAGAIDKKYTQNSTVYPSGYATKDDSFLNIWTAGPNASLGWAASGTSGNGAMAFGRMLSQSQAFPQCMATRVFNRVCLHDPSSTAELAAANQMATDFVNSKFNMQVLFSEAAVQCMGE